MAKGGIGVNIKRNDFPKLLKDSPRLAEKRLDALAEEGVNIAKMSMEDSPATGRTYARTKSGKSHTASSAGNAPRPDIGTLINSLGWEDRGVLQRVIIAATLYAAYLEFGTNDMSPRPFFGPMAQQLEDRAGDIFDGILE